MRRYVQSTVPEQFDPSCASARVEAKENLPTLPAIRSSIGDQRCRGSIGSVGEFAQEFRGSTASTGNRAAIVDERAITCRAGQLRQSSFGTSYRTTIVDERAIRPSRLETNDRKAP